MKQNEFRTSASSPKLIFFLAFPFRRCGNHCLFGDHRPLLKDPIHAPATMSTATPSPPRPLLLLLVSFFVFTSSTVAAFAPQHSGRGIRISSSRLPNVASKRSMSDSKKLPSDEMLDALLEVATNASKLAGDIILKHAQGAEVSERKANSRDLLTLIDPLCEKVSPPART